MSMFVENPVFIVILGVVACLIPLLMWSQSGQSAWLKVCGGVFLLFAAWLAFERWYETDRESLYRSVYHYRDLVSRNEIEKLLQHVDPNSGVRSMIQSQLERYTFTDCRVSSMSRQPKITQVDGQVMAEIEFLGSATVLEFGSAGPFKIRLRLRKIGPGKWQITEAAAARLGDNQPYIDSFDHL